MKRDEGTLLDIAKAAHAVLTFTQGLQKDQFLEDFKTQSAVLYQFHGYDVVDWEEVWRTATRDVPDLLNKLEVFLPQEGSEE